MDTADGTASPTTTQDRPAVRPPNEDLLQRARAARTEAEKLEVQAALHTGRAGELEAEAWRIDPSGMPTNSAAAFFRWVMEKMRYGPTTKRIEISGQQLAALEELGDVGIQVYTPFGVLAVSREAVDVARMEEYDAAILRGPDDTDPDNDCGASG